MQQPQGYPLFRLCRLLRVSGGGGAAPQTAKPAPVSPRTPMISAALSSSSSSALRAKAAAQSSQQQQQSALSNAANVAAVAAAASPGYPRGGHAITAAALGGGGGLLLRYQSGETNVPLVLHVPWSRDMGGDRPVALAFDPNAQWLLVASADATLSLLPAYFLCCKKAVVAASTAAAEEGSTGGARRTLRQYLTGEGAARGHGGDVSALSTSRPHVIRPRSGGSGESVATCCAWWKTFDRCGEFGIVGSASGLVSIVNLVTGEEALSFRVKHPVVRVNVVSDPRQAFRFLLVCTDSGCYRLLLETEVRPRQYLTVIAAQREKSGGGGGSSGGAGAGSEFGIEVLRQFPPDSEVCVQDTGIGPVVGVLSRQTKQLEIYGPEIAKFPLFVFQLPPGTVGFHFTRAVTFAFVEQTASAELSQQSSASASGTWVHVISNLIAGTSGLQKGFVRSRASSVMQRFALGPDERLGGSFYIPVASTQCDEDVQPPVASAGRDPTKLHGCFVWTSRGLFECRTDVHPEKIFFQLVSQGLERSEAEEFGKTLGLDLFGLYEQAADACFQEKDYGRALILYSLSNIRASKFVMKFLSIGRLDIVVSHIRNLLHQADSLPGGDRKMLSNVLFQVYTLRLLPGRADSSGFLVEFEQFIAENKDYDEMDGLQKLVNLGPAFTRLLLLVAHARRRVPEALALLASRGLVHLPPELVKFLMDNGYTEDLKGCRKIFEVLPPVVQVRAILANPQTLPLFFSLLPPLLPLLSVEMLREVAHFFDPLGAKVSSVTGAADRPRSFMGIAQLQERPALHQEEAIELHLTALLLLASKSGHRSAAGGGGGSGSAVNSPRLAAADLPASFQHAPQASVRMSLILPPQAPGKLITSLSCGHAHILVVTDTGEIFSWGCNKTGQLGHGHTQSPVLAPRRLEMLSRVSTMRVAAGGAHSLAVSRNGAVWAWGYNKHGQLGLGQQEKGHEDSKTSPCSVSAFKETWIQQIACGFAHTLFATDGGALFACGQNDQGQLGLGTTDDSHVPQQVNLRDTHKIQFIACGYGHSACCTDAGDVFTWGAGAQGQLGHGDTSNELHPRRVAALHGKHIVSVQCGFFHTVALTDLSNVYSWGHGTQNQLGHGEPMDVPLPRLMQTLLYKRITSLSCGRWHTAATCESGEVYTWGGGGDRGALLGRGMGVGSLPTPKVLGGSLAGKQIATTGCGELFTAALTTTGMLFTWGSNAEGQLGRGDHADSPLPELVDINTGMQQQQQDGSADLESESAPTQLHNALRTQWGNYRAVVVLQRAALLGHWDAVAALHELAGDWHHAFSARIRGILSQELESGNESQAVLDLVEKALSQISASDSAGGLSALRRLFDFWEVRRMPFQLLTDFIAKHSQELSPALAQLILQSEGGAAEDPSWLRALPPESRLRIIQGALVSMHDEGAKAAGEVPLSTLWSEIWTNLPRDAGKRDVLVLSSADIAQLSQQQQQQQEADARESVAFTCGHQFSRRDLNSIILPQFQRLVTSLSTPLPLTAQLAVAEYKQRSIQLACPVCLFNGFLRNERESAAWRP